MCFLTDGGSSRSNNSKRRHRSTHSRHGYGGGRSGRYHVSGDISVYPEMDPNYFPVDMLYDQFGQKFAVPHARAIPSLVTFRGGMSILNGAHTPPMLPEEDDGRVTAIKQSMGDQLKAHHGAVGKEFATKLEETDNKISDAAKGIASKVDAVSKDLAAIMAVQEGEINKRKERERAAELAKAKEEGRAEERKKMEACTKERQRLMIWDAVDERDRAREHHRFRRVRARSPDSVGTKSSDSAYGGEDNGVRGWALPLGEPCPTNHPLCTGYCAHHPELRGQRADPFATA